MWDEVAEVTRLSEIRLGEAMDTDAEIIATACPWCHIQLQDAVQDTENESRIEVKDIAQLLVETL
jgi:Fe-S oxidoreductase